MNYPSPCEKCGKETYCDMRKCAEYHKWICAWWKYFNGVYKELCAPRPVGSEKFIYLHPDEYRRYIMKSPCKSCKAHEKCNTPCATYWKWWDERMEWHRRRLGGGRT